MEIKTIDDLVANRDESLRLHPEIAERFAAVDAAAPEGRGVALAELGAAWEALSTPAADEPPAEGAGTTIVVASTEGGEQPIQEPAAPTGPSIPTADGKLVSNVRRTFACLNCAMKHLATCLVVSREIRTGYDGSNGMIDHRPWLQGNLAEAEHHLDQMPEIQDAVHHLRLKLESMDLRPPPAADAILYDMWKAVRGDSPRPPSQCKEGSRCAVPRLEI